MDGKVFLYAGQWVCVVCAGEVMFVVKRVGDVVMLG